jgi:hypothetical protein
MRDRLIAEVSTCTTHNVHERQTAIPQKDLNHNPSKRKAADSQLRAHDHQDRLAELTIVSISQTTQCSMIYGSETNTGNLKNVNKSNFDPL